MIPPKEYFEQCGELADGAQQVGAFFYRFKDRDCLYAMINDGLFERPIPPAIPPVIEGAELKEKEE